MEESFKRVLIWSGWFRLSHACVGLAALGLLLTGWLIAESPSLQTSALDLHYLMAAFLIFGLLVRAALMFAGKDNERLSALLPAGDEVAAIGATARFYLTMGRSPMPAWYAQNPLWKPLYLLVYLALVFLAGTGAVMPDNDIVFGFYLPSVHEFWARVVLWFSMLHIASVIVHDLKNRTADISAIVNGYRLFLTDTGKARPPDSGAKQYVSLDVFRKDD